MSEAKRDFYGDLVSPASQQAGVSAVPYGKPTLTFGDGEYSCASCGLGMREPCQHWRGFLEAAATAPPEQAAPAKSTLPVGVSVLVTNGELVLLGERINNTASGLLSTPGGRVEQNEDIFACAVRETQEETGLSLTRDLLKVIAWREHFRFGQHYIMFYVHAPQSFGTIINKEPDKCKAWGWRTISQIKSEETTEPLDILALLNPPDPPQAVSAGALIERITAYLSVGGLFNPEMAEHVHVRDLLIACREALLPLAAHDQKVRAETLQEAAKHFPLMGDFGNVIGCEECDWKPEKILQSRQRFIEHVRVSRLGSGGNEMSEIIGRKSAVHQTPEPRITIEQVRNLPRAERPISVVISFCDGHIVKAEGEGALEFYRAMLDGRKRAEEESVKPASGAEEKEKPR